MSGINEEGGLVVGNDYWATSAQVMAVIALAIVVEARAIMSKWRPGESRLFKAFLGTTWSLPLAVFAFAIPACLGALSGQTTWRYWPLLIQLAVAVGVSTVILNPALIFAGRSNAWLVVKALTITARPFLIQPRLRKVREAKEQSFVNLLRLLNIEQQAATRASQLDALEGRVLNGPHPKCHECITLLKEIRQERELLPEVEEEITSAWGEFLETDRLLEGQPEDLKHRYRELAKRLEVLIEQETLAAEVADDTLRTAENRDPVPPTSQ